MQDFRKLAVWQKAHAFVLEAYRCSGTFPPDERYALTSQVRRAALSIPTNIAEGCGRETTAELRRFLYVAMGSAAEVDYLLQAAHDLGYLGPDDHAALRSNVEEIRRMLYALIQRLSGQAKN